MPRATVCEVVAVNNCEDHVPQTPPRERFSGMFGLIGIEWRRSPRCLDAAEAAAARAGVAHQHDSRGGGGFVAAAPAVADIRAAGFFADRVQIQAAQVVLDLFVVLAVRDGGFEPFGEAGYGFLFAFGAHEGGFEGVGFGRWEGGVVVVAGEEFGEGGAGVELVAECCGPDSWAGVGFCAGIIYGGEVARSS